MIGLKVLLPAQATDAQGRGHGELARRQNRPGEQHLRMLPDGLGKERREAYNQARQFGGQCQHGETSLGGVVSQLSYSLTPPQAAVPGRFTVAKSKWVTINFPPGRAWIYSRP